MGKPILLIEPSWLRRMILIAMLGGGVVGVIYALYNQTDVVFLIGALGIGGISLLPLAEGFTDRLIVTEQQLYFRKSFRSVTIPRHDVAEVKWSLETGLTLKTKGDRWVLIPSWHVDPRSVAASLSRWANAV
jgi:hypothetical protein